MKELKPIPNTFPVDLTLADKISIRLSSNKPSVDAGPVSTHQISFRLPSRQYAYVKAVSSLTGATVTDVLQDFVSIAIQQISASEFNNSNVDEVAEIIYQDI